MPSRGRRRRWPAALIAAVTLAVALAIALPVLLTAHTPQKTAGGYRPTTAARSPTARYIGPRLISVPSTIGDTTAKATRVLEAAGFKVQVSVGYPGGNRVEDYGPATPQPRGTTITILVTN